MRDDCLKIFVKLRSPVVKPHAYGIAERGRDMVPKFCHGMVASGWSASVFGVLDKLTPKARMDV